MIEYILDSNKKIFLFAKDKNLKYIFCNEAMAEASGLDSPKQVIGKTDYDLCWCKQADIFRGGDKEVLHGNVLINVQETQIQPTKIANILTSKTILTDKNGNKNVSPQ